MSDDPTLDREFLDEVQSRYDDIKDKRFMRLAGVAYGLESRDYLRWAVEWGARELWLVLPEMALNERSPYRVPAAILCLEMAEAGNWKFRPETIERMRALVSGQPKQEKPMTPEKAKPGRPSSFEKHWSPPTLKDNPAAFLAAVTEEGNRMKAVLDDPGATPEARFEAIQHFLRSMEYLAPEEAQKVFAKAWEAVRARREGIEDILS